MSELLWYVRLSIIPDTLLKHSLSEKHDTDFSTNTVWIKMELKGLTDCLKTQKFICGIGRSKLYLQNASRGAFFLGLKELIPEDLIYTLGSRYPKESERVDNSQNTGCSKARLQQRSMRLCRNSELWLLRGVGVTRFCFGRQPWRYCQHYSLTVGWKYDDLLP